MVLGCKGYSVTTPIRVLIVEDVEDDALLVIAELSLSDRQAGSLSTIVSGTGSQVCRRFRVQARRRLQGQAARVHGI